LPDQASGADATPGNSHRAGRPIAPVVLRIHRWICAAAFLGGIGAGLYYRAWEMIGLFSGGALVGLTFAYMMLASLFGRPGLRWRVFLGDIMDILF
jgi:drug/metabolite transporter (DMT)-like permease